MLRCGAAIFLGGSWSPWSRSRLWLRLGQKVGSGAALKLAAPALQLWFYLETRTQQYYPLSPCPDVATEDIENADEIRTILKDVWDMRQAKLRKSVDTFIQVLADRTAFMDRGALLLVVFVPVSANRTLVMLQRSFVIGCSPHTGICISQ